MIERHLARLRARHEVSAEEEQAIRGLVSETRQVPARTIVIRDGAKLNHSTLLLDGLMCRFKGMRDGGRQITELHVAGDFVDLHSFTLKRLEHNVQSISPCLIGLVPHERIRALIEAYPRIGRLYWFSTNLDAANHREWELSLGRRSAPERMAALFCELHVRLGLIGMGDDRGFQLPITQNELAECLGLTSVHVNRTLRQLREDGLMSFANGRVELLDLAGLRGLAEFDSDYLYLQPDEL